MSISDGGTSPQRLYDAQDPGITEPAVVDLYAGLDTAPELVPKGPQIAVQEHAEPRKPDALDEYLAELGKDDVHQFAAAPVVEEDPLRVALRAIWEPENLTNIERLKHARKIVKDALPEGVSMPSRWNTIRKRALESGLPLRKHISSHFEGEVYDLLWTAHHPQEAAKAKTERREVAKVRTFQHRAKKQQQAKQLELDSVPGNDEQTRGKAPAPRFNVQPSQYRAALRDELSRARSGKRAYLTGQLLYSHARTLIGKWKKSHDGALPTPKQLLAAIEADPEASQYLDEAKDGDGTIEAAIDRWDDDVYQERVKRASNGGLNSTNTKKPSDFPAWLESHSHLTRQQQADQLKVHKDTLRDWIRDLKKSSSSSSSS